MALAYKYDIARFMATTQDVDILICIPPDSDLVAEDIKRMILDVNPRNFFLKLPRDQQTPTASSTIATSTWDRNARSTSSYPER